MVWYCSMGDGESKGWGNARIVAEGMHKKKALWAHGAQGFAAVPLATSAAQLEHPRMMKECPREGAQIGVLGARLKLGHFKVKGGGFTAANYLGDSQSRVYRRA